MQWRAGFDAKAFLSRHWQRRPALFRQVWRAWRNPLAPADLVALACADDIESRLVLRQRRRWHLEHGPFRPARFAALPRRNWTLLVQAVDHHVPAVAALLDSFRFIPDWRIDDVMVSYAVDGGGVGPHFDQYDVFLVQGLGRRRWQVGALCDHTTPLLPHDELSLLARFEPVREWLLEPGDMLYLPPRYAHRGVAVGEDCMTYSIGLRAPSRADLIGHWCDQVIDRLEADDRYTDRELAAPACAGELDRHTLAALHRMVSEALLDRHAFAEWFGRYSSERKYPEHEQRPARALSARQLAGRLARGAVLIRHPASRFAFIRRGPQRLLFVDGEAFACSGDAAALAQRLGARDSRVRATDVTTTAALALTTALYNQGSLRFAHEP